MIYLFMTTVQQDDSRIKRLVVCYNEHTSDAMRHAIQASRMKLGQDVEVAEVARVANETLRATPAGDGNSQGVMQALINRICEDVRLGVAEVACVLASGERMDSFYSLPTSRGE